MREMHIHLLYGGFYELRHCLLYQWLRTFRWKLVSPRSYETSATTHQTSVVATQNIVGTSL